ncbi:hypothetical protein WMY93_019914 [Mugilogobius chulae]|uniref:Secreted protein n=1 Tax=Mugilogobius chulae TaxID=88201 RepID=A0AAW0NMJ8_9GOBI
MAPLLRACGAAAADSSVHSAETERWRMYAVYSGSLMSPVFLLHVNITHETQTGLKVRRPPLSPHLQLYQSGQSFAWANCAVTQTCCCSVIGGFRKLSRPFWLAVELK